MKLNAENYKTLREEIKGGLTKWRAVLCSRRETQYNKDASDTQIGKGVQSNSSQNASNSSVDIGRIILKSVWKGKLTRIATVS